MNTDITQCITRAKEGDQKSLELLITSIQDRIYRLALKMLYFTSDAEDATQEILIKIITKLDSFRQESSFETWALTIAANHLKNKRQNKKTRWFSFSRCEEHILNEIPDQTTLNHYKAEETLVVEELRIRCMQALLQCLNPEHRLTYILGSTMELSAPEGAAILNISAAAFRKRLSRAREGIRGFLMSHCDLFGETNTCNCAAQTMSAVNKGLIKKDNLEFVKRSATSMEPSDLLRHIADLSTMAREVAMMRINQDYQAPEAFIEGIKHMLNVKNATTGLL